MKPHRAKMGDMMLELLMWAICVAMVINNWSGCASGLLTHSMHGFMMQLCCACVNFYEIRYLNSEY